MREVIPELLWIGKALDTREMRTILGAGVTAIIDLAIEEPSIQFPRDIVYCRFPLIDGEGNSPPVLRAAIQMTAHFVRSEIPTLVACSAGMSRSPAIVAAALSCIEEIPLAATLYRVTTDQPHDVSPSLLGEIIEALNHLRE